jgi:ABC-type multidrug transport system fused ATPase/permease subunit
LDQLAPGFPIERLIQPFVQGAKQGVGGVNLVVAFFRRPQPTPKIVNLAFECGFLVVDRVQLAIEALAANPPSSKQRQHDVAFSLGDYVAFTAYVGYMTGPLTQITTLFTDFQRGAVGLGRMFDHLDQPPEQDPALAYAPPPPIATVVRGEISMRGVCFGYSAGREVLHDVSVCFPRGAITAIVGPSGAGKSSLLRLILRMEEPDAGEVCVDGAPITSLSIPDLRRQMAVVWQEFSLVQGTIWDNLTLGAEEPSRARVDDAVRLCRLKSLIDELPDGYDTHVGEWGATLSGGQRQRIALVRALVRDAPVLLLDEAMANVDMQTESLILRDLLARQEGKTVIFVTHRVSTAALADHVVMVAAGRVAAAGTHAELMRDSEAYRKLQGGGMEDPRRPHAVPAT